jgi:hypothetical protein
MKTASFKTYTGPGRISIARDVPRQTPDGYRAFKRLAPGAWSNAVSKVEYERLYRLEVLSKLDPAETLAKLTELAGGAEPVLMCWERPPFTASNFCHRRMVADWLERSLGIEVPEIDYEHTGGLDP